MSGVRTGFALATAAIVASAFCCSSAQAQVYRWKDASGNTHYTDTPPPTSAKEYRTVTPPDPNAPRDPRTLPRHAMPAPVTAQTPVQSLPRSIDQTVPPTDVQQQIEENRKYLRAQQNDKARKERALRDASQCTEWYKALGKIEQAEKEAGPRKRGAGELRELAQTKTELNRNIAARCQ